VGQYPNQGKETMKKVLMVAIIAGSISSTFAGPKLEEAKVIVSSAYTIFEYESGSHNVSKLGRAVRKSFSVIGKKVLTQADEICITTNFETIEMLYQAQKVANYVDDLEGFTSRYQNKYLPIVKDVENLSGNDLKNALTANSFYREDDPAIFLDLIKQEHVLRTQVEDFLLQKCRIY
jgi:hypothetical protein